MKRKDMPDYQVKFNGDHYVIWIVEADGTKVTGWQMTAKTEKEAHSKGNLMLGDFCEMRFSR